jgi:hypothetical protein
VHSFRCPHCGGIHSGIPLVWGPNAPSAMLPIPEPERSRRVALSEDECVIDRATYLVRGCLDLPIRGTGEVFRWLVWVIVDRQGHHYSTSLWRRLLRQRHPPYGGELDTPLPYDPPTSGLPVEVRSAGPGFRPAIVITDPAHPLAKEQHEGLLQERAYELAGRMLHSWEGRGA